VECFEAPPEDANTPQVVAGAIAGGPVAAPVKQPVITVIKPAEVRRVEIKPAGVMPTQIERVEVKPVAIKPAEVKPTVIERSAIRPVEIKPAGNSAAGLEPSVIEPDVDNPVVVKALAGGESANHVAADSATTGNALPSAAVVASSRPVAALDEPRLGRTQHGAGEPVAALHIGPADGTVATVTTAAPSTPIVAHSASPMPTAAARPVAAPANLGMIGVDRVRFAREQAPSRAVQRLAIDLDGAQVAVRFHGDHVAVDVLNDPAGSLGNGWARQVERSLDQAVRTVSEPLRGGPPAEQTNSQTSGSGRGGANTNANTSDNGEPRQRPSQRAFTWLPDEEED
jgi:hypothetical protein